jgi:UMF1 family MFS transporter
VSSAGYAIGYLGGGILLAINLAWILQPAWFGLADAGMASRLSFLSVAIWWLVFAIPLFRHVPEPAASAVRQGGVNPIVQAFRQLATTLRELRQYRQAFLMLVAFLIYNDGIGTIIRMAGPYGQEIGLPQESLILAFVMVQFVGIPFAFAFGRLADRIGAKPSIFIALVVYVLISLVGYFMTTIWQFFLLSFMVATVQGGSQALSRSLFATMIPKRKSSEFFGFFGVFEKFAGIIGPALFAATVRATGTSRNAILSVIAFFVVGAVLLWMVDVPAGQRAAREADETVVP